MHQLLVCIIFHVLPLLNTPFPKIVTSKTQAAKEMFRFSVNIMCRILDQKTNLKLYNLENRWLLALAKTIKNMVNSLNQVIYFLKAKKTYLVYFESKSSTIKKS